MCSNHFFFVFSKFIFARESNPPHHFTPECVTDVPKRHCACATVRFSFKNIYLDYPDVKFSENFFTSITFCALQHIQKLEVLYFKNRTFRISSSFQKSVSPRVFTLVSIFFYRQFATFLKKIHQIWFRLKLDMNR